MFQPLCFVFPGQEALQTAPKHGVMLPILLCLVAALAAPAVAAPTLEDQVDAIARELMCPVCAGQTVAESNATLAVQMRAEIRRRLLAGQTREQIIAYFVGEFGESVLAAPPKRGVGLALWLGPVAAFAVGLLVMVRYLRRITRPRSPTTP